MNLHQKIVNSDFDPFVIKESIVESYDTFYDSFSDILLPYYIPLILIYKQNSITCHD
jgi:hypothetical protein